MCEDCTHADSCVPQGRFLNFGVSLMREMGLL